MENVLLDQSSASLELRTRAAGRWRRGPGAWWAAPHGGYWDSFPVCPPQPYHQHQKVGAWSSAPAPVLPYARPPIHSSPSLPLLPSNQPPLLPLPPTATKHATFPCLPAAPPPRRAGMVAAAATAAAPAAPALAPCQQRDRRRRRPARPPPPSSTEPPRALKKKPLERATPLPPAPAVDAALDDLEQEVARNFVQDLLHALAPPPSSLPLPRFSLVVKPSPATAAPSCTVEAAAADAIGGLLRL